VRQALGALVTEMAVVWIAREPAISDHRNLGEESGEGAHRRRLCRAALTANEHAADKRIKSH